MINHRENIIAETTGQEKRVSVLGNADEFIKKLKGTAKEAKPEQILELLNELERFSQSPDRRMEVYTDPNLETFCCGQVPSKTFDEEGNIINDPTRKTYLIGVPFIFAAGGAPLDFLRGEILHEQGHAKYTDFGRHHRLKILARQEGYDPKEILSLNNVIEDPRMERVVGGPLHQNERRLLFEKNRQFIIPNISEGLKREGAFKMSPSDQFKFLLKLVGLWSIYGLELADEKPAWDWDKIEPLVRTEFQKIEPTLRRIVGDAQTPALKVGAEVERLLVEEIWPAYKRIIDKFPEEKTQEREKPLGGLVIEGPNMDVDNPETWPEPLKSIFRKMKLKHEERLKAESDKIRQAAKKNEDENKRLEEKENELAKARGDIENPRLREEYENLKNEVRPFISQLRRVFDRLLPKTKEEDFEWSKRGNRFDARRLTRLLGTGRERPLGRRLVPEQNALVLQVLVDVSGSMYGDAERIKNAVKACIVLGEAIGERDIILEILASDDGNVGKDEKYLIKDFNEKFDSQVKTRIVDMMRSFGGYNKDDKAIEVAIPRLQRKVSQSRKDFDRVGSLGIFITDSTTQDIKTREMVEKARSFTPLEGTAITPETEIPQMVKFHFGPDSIIPRSLEEFPQAFAQILERHLIRLKGKS